MVIMKKFFFVKMRGINAKKFLPFAPVPCWEDRSIRPQHTKNYIFL